MVCGDAPGLVASGGATANMFHRIGAPVAHDVSIGLAGQFMKRTWPIIAVADVTRSSAWYMKLLDAQENHTGSKVFNQILNGDGVVLLCLHR